MNIRFTTTYFYFKVLLSAFSITVLVGLHACKDPIIKDNGITTGLGEVDLAHWDTTQVWLSTVDEHPLLSSSASTCVIGSMDDPKVGKTYGSLYAQCLLGSNGVSFHVPDSAATVDSAVLIIPYYNDSARYGKCTASIDLLVYELNQDMNAATSYYDNDAFSIYSQPIGRLNGWVPNLKDSVAIMGVKQAPQIRIPLSASFANKLLNTDSISLAKSSDFVNYLKGIYVTTNTARAGNGVVYPYTTASLIRLYYHNSGRDTITYDFPISQYSARFNHFDHIYTGYDIQARLSNPSATGDSKAYIQSAGGTKIKMRLPTLDSLPKKIAVTKAELILPVLQEPGGGIDSDQYALPTKLYLQRLDDTLGAITPNSYNNQGQGYLSSRLDRNGQSYICYVFNLTEMLQRYISGYFKNNGFYIEYSYTVRADRVAISNDRSKPENQQSRLNITYTRLK